MSSSMEKTLKMLRLEMFYPWKVEQYNGFSGRRTDLYHIIDLVFLTKKKIVGVQVCGADFAAHIKKMLNEEEFHTKYWLNSKATALILIGWRKVKHKRGGKLMVFRPRLGVFWYVKKKDQLHFKEVDQTWPIKKILNQKEY